MAHRIVVRRARSYKHASVLTTSPSWSRSPAR